jgi:hypothetical protein
MVGRKKIKMENTSTVMAVVNRWSSCGCNDCSCFQDMAEVVLDNGMTVTTTFCSTGDTLYFWEDVWNTFPEEEPDSFDEVWNYYL